MIRIEQTKENNSNVQQSKLNYEGRDRGRNAEVCGLCGKISDVGRSVSEHEKSVHGGDRN